MKGPIYQVDAFTSRLFHGNPAAVVLLGDWLRDEVLQAVAAAAPLSIFAAKSRFRTEHMRIGWLALAMLVGAMPAMAQSAQEFRTPKLVVAVEGRYGSPERGAAGASVMVPLNDWHCEDGLCGGAGLEAKAIVGVGGWGIAAGPVAMRYPFWMDLLATVVRTSEHPRHATPLSTWVGGEAGFAFPVWMIRNQLIAVRPSLGATHRVRGAPGGDTTILTWSIGVHVLWTKY